MTLAAPIFAIVTPFADDGRIDDRALASYLNYLGERGVVRIVAGGTTGEFPSLSIEERKHLLEQCRSLFPGEVLAHVSATAVADVRELLRHAEKFADAALLLPAYYYADAPPAGMVDFLVQCTSGTELPLYLYNFPKHTQHPVTPDLLTKARERIPALRGVKDSSGSVEKALTLAEVAEGLEIYVGSDNSALRVLQEGLAGSVTGGANPVPDLFRDLYEGFSRQDLAAASAAQERLNTWTDLRKAFPAPEISVVKSALSAVVADFHPYVRPPMVGLSEDVRDNIQRAVREFMTGENS